MSRKCWVYVRRERCAGSFSLLQKSLVIQKTDSTNSSFLPMHFYELVTKLLSDRQEHSTKMDKDNTGGWPRWALCPPDQAREHK